MIKRFLTKVRSQGPQARRGFTLVEMMVAIIVLGVGMLGLAGFSLAAGKQMRGASLQQTAAMVVQSRLDSVASVTCNNLAAAYTESGNAMTLGVSEHWVIADGNDIKTVTDTVSFKWRSRKLVYKSIIPCRD